MEVRVVVIDEVVVSAMASRGRRRPAAAVAKRILNMFQSCMLKIWRYRPGTRI